MKNKKKPYKNKKVISGMVITLSLSIILVIIVGIYIYKWKEKEEDHKAGKVTQESKLEFPYKIEGTDITIESLSQASVPNPDSDGTMIDDIACVEVKNNGDAYISSVDFILEMQDGTEFNFKITDMPAGTLVQAFDVNNTVYDEENVCEEIKTENLKEENGSQLMEDAIQISVDETIVTLTNITGEPLENLSIVCHCDMDGSYFGGCSYTYNVESISAGGSIDLDASDCYLGQASVVRISKNN